MACMLCGLVGDCAKECTGCKATMGDYYCDDCHLWEDRQDKEIYHCDKCGICRVGKGLDEDYFHCDTCDVCLSIALKGDHKCIERTLHANCPICGDYLFESRQTVIFMVLFIYSLLSGCRAKYRFKSPVVTRFTSPVIKNTYKPLTSVLFV